MMEEEDKVTYQWVHPDVITWGRNGQVQGHLFRSWEVLKMDFDHFSIMRSRHFRSAPSSLDIVSTHDLEKHLEHYNSLSAEEKRERLSDKHYLQGIYDEDHLDGYLFHATGDLPEDFRVHRDQVENFGGKDSSGWQPNPRMLKTIEVVLGPSKRQHGGFYCLDALPTPSLSLSVDPEVFEGVLADLISSPEKKRVTLTFQVLLWEYHRPHADGGRGMLFFPYNTRSVPAILNNILVTMYERKAESEVTLTDADLAG